MNAYNFLSSFKAKTLMKKIISFIKWFGISMKEFNSFIINFSSKMRKSEEFSRKKSAISALRQLFFVI
jgi:hypothetical protein